MRNIEKARQKGQAAIESLLIIMPLMGILCAIIDFSMALFIRNSLTFAAREGVRYAITGQTGAGGHACQDASIKHVVQQNAMGVLHGEERLAKIRINYYDQSLGDISVSPNANQGGSIVRVSVTGVPWLWMLSGIWEHVNSIYSGGANHYSGANHYTGLTMGAASSDIMEPPPNGIRPCR